MANYKSDKYSPGGGGVGVQYQGPGSSLKKNRKVGAGQDVPKKKVGAGNMGKVGYGGDKKKVGAGAGYEAPKTKGKMVPRVGGGQDTPAEEKREKKAESKENRAIKDLQSAQKMEQETGAGQMPMRGMMPGMMPARPPMIPGGAIPPAGRRPGKVARRVPTAFRRGR